MPTPAATESPRGVVGVGGGGGEWIESSDGQKKDVEGKQLKQEKERTEEDVCGGKARDGGGDGLGVG